MADIRVGIGYDCHRFAEGRRLVLGGVEVPHDKGLAGHSDADVVTHAAIDALLGAAGLGDIGTHFPDDSEQWQGADSLELASEVKETLEKHGWSIVNVDVTLILESPRISEYRELMSMGIAKALGLEIEQASVKATTNEGMGFIGRGEGAGAIATALLERQ